MGIAAFKAVKLIEVKINIDVQLLSAKMITGDMMSDDNSKSPGSGNEKREIKLYEQTGAFLSSIQQNIFDLCNIKPRNRVHSVGGHTDWIREVFITHDGTRLVSVSDDCTARLWDMATGRCLMAYTGHTGTVRGLAITRDDRFLVTGSWDKTIRIWVLETGECLKVLEGHIARIRSIAISNDGKTIYSGSEDTTARKWDMESGECLFVYSGHKKAVRVIALSPDGQFLFSGSEDATIKKWDTVTGQLMHVFTGHNGEIFTIVINQDGTEMFSGGRDGVVMRWNLAKNLCFKKYKGHKNWIMTIDLSPDEGKLLSGDLDGIVKIWDVEQPSHPFTFGGPTWGVNALRFSADSSSIAFGSEHRAGIINIKTKDCVLEFKGHSKNVSSLCLDETNTNLVTSGWDGITNVWSIRTGQLNFKFSSKKTKGSGILSHFISKDSRYLATGSDNGYVSVWDLSTGKHIHSFNTKTDNIHGICITPDLKFIIICCRELYENLRFYDFTTGDLVKSFWGHDNTVFTIDLSRDGTLLASGSADNTVRIWDVASGNCLHIFHGHDDWVETVRISNDNRYLVTGGCDLKVRVWEISTEKLINEYSDSTHTIYSVDISHDNSMVMAGGNDKAIRIWDVASGKLIDKIDGNDYQLYSARFDRQGKHIVTSGKYSIKLWSLSTGIMLREFSGFTNSVCAMYVNPYTCDVLLGSWEFGAKRLSIKMAMTTNVYRYCMSATYAVYLSPSGERVAAGGRCVLTNLLDAETGKQLRWFEHEETVNALLLNSRGSYLFTASSDHCARKWNTNSISCNVVYRGHKGAVYDLKLSRDEKRLYTCSADSTIKEWDTDRGSCLKTFSGHKDAVSKIHLSWDELTLISGSKDGTVRVWDLLSGFTFLRIDAGYHITVVGATIDGLQIVTGSSTGKLSVWDSTTGKCIRQIDEHLGWISGLSFLEMENMMITASYDGTVKFWALDTFELRASYYNLNEGFLWTTPPEEKAPSGRFWTNRMDIINVLECEKGGERPEILNDNHPERENYLKLYNNKELVIKRINTKHLIEKKADVRPVVSERTKLIGE